MYRWPSVLRASPSSPFNEPHETNDSHREYDLPPRAGTFNPSLLQQRQPPFYPYSRPSTSSGSPASQILRRTPNIEESRIPFRPRSTSLEARTSAAHPEPQPQSQAQAQAQRQDARPQQQQPTVRFAEDPRPSPTHRRAVSASSTPSLTYPYTGSIHPALRVSRGRASAIQWVLETALRGPREFTPVLDEENEQMSDLTGNGRIAASNGGASRLGPVPVPQQSMYQQPPPPIQDSPGGRQGSPSQIPAGMRTPTMIMAERLRKAEALKQQQEAEQQQQRQGLPEQRRRQPPAPSASQPIRSGGHTRTQSLTTGQGRDPGQQPTFSYRQPAVEDEPSMGRLPDPPPVPTQQPQMQQPPPPPQQQQQQRSRVNPLGEPIPVQQMAGQGAPRTQPRTAAQQQQQPQQQPQTAPGATQRRSRRPTEPEAEAGPSNTGTGTQRSTQSSFPHAFERWEDLSSHWEGLTSFWIHKLEHDAEEVSRIPLGQQMSRQITDLAAAGANLFHAVVELQRLRASSERKFSRWFIETRRDMERSSEVNADLERQLNLERNQQRLDPGQMQELERRVQRAEKVADEARRELAISKDEARRAWEELGRREQEERERQQALRDGIPILIGGVQVFPTPAGASRQASLSQRPSTRDGSGQQPYPQVPPGAAQYVGQQPHFGDDTSPTNTDPFTETRAQQGYPGISPYIAGATPATSTASARTMIPVPQASSRDNTSRQPAQQGGLYSHPATSAEQQHPYVSTSAAGLPERDAASYVETPSNAGDEDDILSASDELGEGEDEWEIDSNGNYRLDSRGQPIRWRRGLRQSTADPGVGGGAEADVDDDDDDVRDDVQRERVLARQYRTGASSSGAASSSQQQPAQQPITYPPIPPSSSAAMAAHSAPTAGGLTVPGAMAPPQAPHAPGAYEGAEGYEEGEQGQAGIWENMRHHHPTRLSDVMEEDERSRTTGE